MIESLEGIACQAAGIQWQALPEFHSLFAAPVVGTEPEVS